MRCGGEDRLIHASRVIEHPGRNLKPARRDTDKPNNIARMIVRLMLQGPTGEIRRSTRKRPSPSG